MARPKGISLPVRANARGGITLADAEAYIDEVVLRACSPNYSDNPFDALPLPEDIVFAINDPALKMRAIADIRRAFLYLERIGFARLASDESIKFETGEVEGEATLQVRYINLQTQEPGLKTRRLRPL